MKSLILIFITLLMSCANENNLPVEIVQNDNFLSGILTENDGKGIDGAIVVLYSTDGEQTLAKSLESNSFLVALDSVKTVDGAFKFLLNTEGDYSIKAFVKDSMVSYKENFEYKFNMNIDLSLRTDVSLVGVLYSKDSLSDGEYSEVDGFYTNLKSTSDGGFIGVVSGSGLLFVDLVVKSDREYNEEWVLERGDIDIEVGDVWDVMELYNGNYAVSGTGKDGEYVMLMLSSTGEFISSKTYTDHFRLIAQDNFSDNIVMVKLRDPNSEIVYIDSDYNIIKKQDLGANFFSYTCFKTDDGEYIFFGTLYPNNGISDNMLYIKKMNSDLEIIDSASFNYSEPISIENNFSNDGIFDNKTNTMLLPAEYELSGNDSTFFGVFRIFTNGTYELLHKYDYNSMENLQKLPNGNYVCIAFYEESYESNKQGLLVELDGVNWNVV